MLWDYKAGSKTLIKEVGNQARIIKWNTNDTNKIAVGCDDGSVYIYDVTSKQVKHLKPSEGKGDVVTDLQWDPLSTNYLLVAYKSGKL
jgi:WD40 repeat protein